MRWGAVMRERSAATILLLLGLLPALSQAADAAGAHDLPKTADVNLPYPGQIDLEQESSGWTYRSKEQRLYMSTADPPGKSVCNGACAKMWPPVIAPSSSKPLGDWTIITREDGQRQWAFKNHPVYTHASNAADKPSGAMGTFRLMPHFR